MHYDNYNLHCVISIHALLAESDAFDVLAVSALMISIHALLAESDNQPGKSNKLTGLFLSTLSLRRATSNFTQKKHPLTISIHALLAESDSGVSTHCKAVSHFYPRSPCGERHNESAPDRPKE